jgi:hypothetical protein
MRALLMQDGWLLHGAQDGSTAIHEACRGDHVHVVQWLVEAGYDVKDVNFVSVAALFGPGPRWLSLLLSLLL